MKQFSGAVLLYCTALVLAPFFMGVILKVKAFFGGKKGPSLAIRYQTLAKLLRKGSVYSRSTTFIFKLGPLVSLAASLTGLAFLPVAGQNPVFSFQGDIVFIWYLFGLARFFTVTAALDTASPFEGMGAAREVFFGFLAEATIFLVFLQFALLSGQYSLASFLAGSKAINISSQAGFLLVLIIPAIFFVMLTENARVPVDDPATHLELTMIHEVMILDHSGPDLAIIEAGVFARMLFYATFIANLLLPRGYGLGTQILLFSLLVLLLYIGIGVLESITARLKMDQVPKFILTSFALAFFAIILSLEVTP
ncbi:MAG TPA: hydrogenase [Desulfobulbaceae bacterium]|nr:hydrogenase [Desulfobulbaceae bacterium]